MIFLTAYRHIWIFKMLKSSICFSVLLVFICSFAFPCSRKLCRQIQAKTCTFHRYLECTVRFDWTTYRRIHLHCGHLIEVFIRRANIENASRCLAQGRFGRTWELNVYYVLTARPSSRRSDTHLKQYPCIALLLWSNTMKHAYLGEDSTGRHWSTTLSQTWDIL